MKTETRGGAREGAGAPRKGPITCEDLSMQTDDPTVFLTAVMRSAEVDMTLRVDCAKALRRGTATGKKAAEMEAAQDVVKRDLSPAPAPTGLRAVK